jgi:PKD repeat protein
MPRGVRRLSSLILALSLSVVLGLPRTSTAQSLSPADHVGACCLGADDCEFLAPDDCAERGGIYRGDGTTCEEAHCAIALSPVIGVDPTTMDFGRLCPGDCRDGMVTLRNAVNDPESHLIISDLLVNPPFELVDPPETPFTIPGDGTLVPLTLRYCASAPGSQIGGLTIVSPNAYNSPFLVPLNGFGDLPPLCHPGGPYFSHLGQPIVFDASSSSDPGGTITSYVWDFGDGSTGTGAVVSHTYAAFGTYTVTLDLTDDCGGTSSCQTTASVVENLPPICDAGGPYNGVAGIPIAMSGAGSSDPDGTIIIYRWDFGDGQTGSGVNQTHTYAAQGDYTVTLTVIDNQNASSSCTTIAHVENKPPICDAGGPYQGVVGQPITFDGSGSTDPDGTIVSYEWDFADCATGTGPNPTHAYTTAGAYIVTLCVTDNEGALNCCQASVQIEGGPARQARAFFEKQAAEMQPVGANPQISFPLHAKPGCHGCTAYLPVDCEGNRPTVNIPGNMNVTIYLLAYNYTALAAVQTAFDWNPSWNLFSAIFDCLPGQLTVVTPAPPGGPTAGTVATTFDCVTSGSLLVIGRLYMHAGSTGCLRQVQSTYPNGIHAVDCNLGVDLITDSEGARLGKICVGQGGNDACGRLIPVQATTWGQVKATYR